MTRKPAYLSTGEVADLCGVDVTTVRRWAAAGQIEFIRLPSGHRRFTPAAVDALLTKDNVDATTQEAVA